MTHRRSIVVLVIALLVAIAGLGLLSNLMGELDSGGLDVRNGVAQRTADSLAERFDVHQTDVIAIVGAADGSDAAVVPGALRDIETRLDGLAGVASVTTPDGPGSPLRADEVGTALVLASLHGNDREKSAMFPGVVSALRSTDVEVVVGGPLGARQEGQQIAEHDLVRGELLTLPVVAILLAVFFRGVLPALLPVGVGAFAIGGTVLVMRVVAVFFPVSTFALNVVTFVGLGLSIDYSLFLVHRFRLELAAGRQVDAARRVTLRTAGKTVGYSAAAVAASLLSLVFIPIPLVRSIAVGGSVVVVMAVVGALLVLPAAMQQFHARLAPSARATEATKTEASGTWHRIAQGVMRRPVITAVTLLVALVAVGLPSLRMRPATSSPTSFPTTSETYTVQARLVQEFPDLGSSTIDVLVTADDDRDVARELADLADSIRDLPGVTRVVDPREAFVALGIPDRAPAEARDSARQRVRSAFVDGAHGRLSVVSELEPGTPESDALIEAMHGLSSQQVTVATAGPAAIGAESHAAIGARIPYAVGSVAVATFVVLVLAFGAPVVAIKALLMNVLSLSASFGALVLVFQDGRFENVLGYSSTGTIDVLIPLLVFAIVFGLSMDYELFLLSRIREDWVQTRDATGSVARGLETTAGIITSAALVLIVVMIGFAASRLLFLRELGVAMVIAVVVDATIIRALLVPATMALLGRANWWAPARFSAWWRRHGIGVYEGKAGEPLDTAKDA